VGIYSFNKGKEIIEKTHPKLLGEINSIITSIDASQYKSKKSKEKTMKGRMLYSPVKMNKAFKSKFQKLKWQTVRENATTLNNFTSKDILIRKREGLFERWIL
jgi:hypothetical protein